MKKFIPAIFLLMFFLSITSFKFNSKSKNFGESTPSRDTFPEFTETAGDVNMDFVFIEGGTFDMGSNEGDFDEKPVHSETVEGFYMSKYEVTVYQFSRFIKETKYKTEAEKRGWSWVLKNGDWKHGSTVSWKFDTQKGGITTDEAANYPVTHVSYNDAVAFCNWLSKITGFKYRLPTETEWEYAASAGGKYKKWAGTDEENSLDDFAWCKNNSNESPHIVGQKKPNDFGLYDMSGNVWEWCNDWYTKNYDTTKTNKSQVKPVYRIIRGGSWFEEPYGCRITNRGHALPDPTVSNIGFRVVCEL